MVTIQKPEHGVVDTDLNGKVLYVISLIQVAVECELAKEKVLEEERRNAKDFRLNGSEVGMQEEHDFFPRTIRKRQVRGNAGTHHLSEMPCEVIVFEFESFTVRIRHTRVYPLYTSFWIDGGLRVRKRLMEQCFHCLDGGESGKRFKLSFRSTKRCSAQQMGCISNTKSPR